MIQNSILKRYINGEWVPVVVGARGFTGSAGFTSGTQSVSLTGLTGGISSTPAIGDLVCVFYGVGGTTSTIPTTQLTVDGYWAINGITQ